MGYTFTFGDVEKICLSLGLTIARDGRHWSGFGLDGIYRRIRLDSHGRGRELATGTAREIARQLQFRNLEDMYEFLRRL